MSPHWKITTLVFIIFLALFFRLFDLKNTPPGLYPDEAMNGNNAVEALEETSPTGGFKVFYPENNGREGLFMNIQAGFLSLTKLISPGGLINEPWALRLPSALFGILTVLGVFFLTKELFGNYEIALLASFLIAISFWHINFSRIGFRAIMAPAFLTWALYFLLLSLRKNSKWFLPALGGLIYGLGMHSYIAYRATPLLIVLGFWFLTFRYGWKSVLRIGAIFTLAAIIVFLPLGFYFLDNPQDFFGRTSQISIFSSATLFKDLSINVLKTAGMFNISGDWNWRHNIAGQPLLFWPVGILFLVGVLFGLRAVFRKVSRSVPREQYLQSYILLFSWLIVAALPVVISNEGLPHALRAIIMIPPVFILAAIGGREVYNWLSKKISKRILLNTTYTLLALLIIEAYVSYFIIWGRNPEVAGSFNQNYVEIGRELNNLPQELPKYVLVEARGTDVRGIPMPTQTVMFITDTFSLEKQQEKNIHYVLPSDVATIPPGSFVVTLN
ncbi:MAG: glycosyltransferase family 39 protein [Patescibacteria group bacterium]|nr:glycosyltransferase family 39 protein [Patescibacteria group bacterium]